MASITFYPSQFIISFPKGNHVDEIVVYKNEDSFQKTDMSELNRFINQCNDDNDHYVYIAEYNLAFVNFGKTTAISTQHDDIAVYMEKQFDTENVIKALKAYRQYVKSLPKPKKTKEPSKPRFIKINRCSRITSWIKNLFA